MPKIACSACNSAIERARATLGESGTDGHGCTLFVALDRIEKLTNELRRIDALIKENSLHGRAYGDGWYPAEALPRVRQDLL